MSDDRPLLTLNSRNDPHSPGTARDDTDFTDRTTLNIREIGVFRGQQIGLTILHA